MQLSSRIRQVSASLTIAITSRAAEMRAAGQDVVSFGAGEPDFDTPQFIKDAAIGALQAGDTKYTPRKGKALCQAISDKLQKENNLNIPPDQVLVTFGGKHACFSACQVVLDPGDKCLIPAPCWVSYPEMVKLAGAQPVILETGPQNHFKITPQQILAAGKDAKAIFLNSPSNPTGMTYTPEELLAIGQACIEADLFVFSDEIYEKLIYGNTRFVSFAALDDRLPQRTLTLNGLSKTYSMTGWRLGWAAGPKDVIDAMKCLHSHQTTNPVSFAQAGALAAYTDPRAADTLETMRTEFETRGKHMAARLNSLDGVSCLQPTGAFYCFPDVSGLFGRTLKGHEISDSMSFASAALEEMSVALVPGIAFGADTCVRLSFATSMDQIDKGLDRLEQLLSA